MTVDAGSAAIPRPEPVPRALAELGRRLGLTAVPDLSVTGITHDSRAVQPGDLYAALPGARSHGAAYAAEAARAGATAILTDPAGAVLAAGVLPVLTVPDPRGVLGEAASWTYGDPSHRVSLLGVTGTNGKTTTAYLLEAGLRAAGHHTGLIGTIEVRIAGEALPAQRTTPEAPDLQALLAVMVERGVSAVAMEVSSHALALGRVAGCRFTAGAFTNLSQDHLDFHGDLETYFLAKASLFTSGLSQAAVVCTDDDAGQRLARLLATDLPGLPLTTFRTRPGGAADPPAPRPGGRRLDASRWGPEDWRVTTRDCDATGSSVTVSRSGGDHVDLRVGLPGAFNVANAVTAWLTLVSAGEPRAAAAEGIGKLSGVPGRMEAVDTGQPYAALVDYAHTPDAVARVLEVLRPLTPGRLVIVLGCGGDRDAGKRPLMGRAAAVGADLAVLTSDNPRSEPPARILEQMRAGVPGGTHVIIEPDRAAAIERALRGLQAGDTVVVAGKGHENGQDVDGRVLPFDDRTVLAAAIRRTGSTCT